MSRRVLVVGWDAADWNVIDPLLAKGALPSLARLVGGGSAGNLASLQPRLSPILWTSIATGKAPWRHGIHGFVEPKPDLTGVRPVGSASRRCKALWNIASQAGKKVHCAGWFASHPAERINGVCISDQFAVAPEGSAAGSWPVAVGSVQPESMVDALAEFRWHPAENTAQDLQPFLHEAAGLDQANTVQQHRIRFLSRTLAQCVSVHGAATWLMEHEPWDLMMVYYEAIDQAGHEFMPFHPPRLPGVSDKDFHHWHPAMEGIYRFHDLMLGRLIELAGEDTVIVLLSDHGFVSGALRPGPVANDPATQASWHRSQGILALHGPGIMAGEKLSGASLLDITPTVLHLMGLPVGEDMDGKVLAAAFTARVSPDRIPSWEDTGPPLSDFMAPAVADEAAQAALVQQFVALGYLEAPADPLGAIRNARNEMRFNESQARAAAGHWQKAAELLEQLVADAPDLPRYRLALANALLVTGRVESLSQTICHLPAAWRESPDGLLMRTQIFLAEQRTEEAAVLITDTADRFPQHAGVRLQQGLLLLRSRSWVNAEQVFRQCLTLDPDGEYAWHGLAASLVEQDRTEEAIDAALNAVGLRHHFPEAHFVLGRALVRQSEPAKAIRALETALAQNPAHQASHSILARLHFRLGNPQRSWQHREVLRALRGRARGEMSSPSVPSR